MVICLERGADLHMAQLMPLPLTASCCSKIQIGFTFLVPAHPGSPGQRAVKRVYVVRPAAYWTRSLSSQQACLPTDATARRHHHHQLLMQVDADTRRLLDDSRLLIDRHRLTLLDRIGQGTHSCHVLYPYLPENQYQQYQGVVVAQR